MDLFLSVILCLAVLRFGAVEPFAWLGLSLVLLAGFAARAVDAIRRPTDPRVLLVMTAPILTALFVDPKLALGPMAGIAAWIALRGHPRSTVRFLHLLLGVGVFEALLGLYQYFIQPGWIFGYINGSYDTSGTLINRNHFAGLLGMLIPVAVGLAYLAWQRYRDAGRAWVYLLASGLMGLALLFSLSRMGIFSLFLTLALMALLLGLHSVRLGTAFLAIPLVLVVGGGLWTGVDVIVERYDRLISPDGDIRESRIGVFRDTLDMIRENPMGVGPGAYRDAFRRYQRERTDLVFDHAHNDYLETAAEWGVPVAALFWAGILAAFAIGLRAFARAREAGVRAGLLAALGAVFYVLAHSLTDFNLQIPSNAMLFFTFVGLAMSLAQTSPTAGSPPEGPSIANGRRGPRIVALAMLACSLLAVARLWGPFRAAWIARDAAADPEVYERALAYDPLNPDYHFSAAEIYHLSARYRDPDRALVHYRAAVAGNPDRSAHWLGLSKLLESRGDANGARQAMRQALETDPRDARAGWAGANLYLRLGDLETADDALARVAALDVAYLEQVLDLVWRFYDEPARIMARHVPDTKDGNLIALRYFIHRDSPDGAALAWSRLRRFPTAAAERLGWVDYLIALGEPREAYEVFLDGEDAPGVFNGGFEAALSNGGFDWRFGTSGPGIVRRDSTRSKEGRASLVIEFTDADNPSFAGVWHWLPVEAGRLYELEFSMRTEAITTDEGIYLEVDGEASDPVAGTTSWKQHTIRFPASSDLVRIRVRRDPTRKLDNVLNGRVWLDDFHLTPLH